jgi:Zn-dependent protease
MSFLNGSFRIGRLFGINIRVHILFVLWMGWNLLAAGRDWRFQLIWTGMVFGIVLVHEFGHCFGARAVGGGARNILLWPLGGLAYAEAPMRPWNQFVTVAAGPIVHPIFCAVSAAVLIRVTNTIAVVPWNPFRATGFEHLTAEWQGYVWLFFRINLWMLCFNLLPVFPFDGGQLFRVALWPILGMYRATILATQVGIAGAVLLGLLGINRREMILVAIAIFSGMTSYQHYLAARAGLVMEDFVGADRVARGPRHARGFWSRLFGRRTPARAHTSGDYLESRPPPNPNPGAWQAKQTDRARLEAELDRILQKVAERGLHSLSYVERQTLERASRERQEREREFEPHSKP